MSALRTPESDAAPRTEPVRPPLVGLDYEWLFDGPVARVSRYRCLAETRAMVDARSQPWAVVGFPNRGAWLASFGKGTEFVVDSSTALFLNPGEEYRASHPFHLHDTGHGVVLAEGVLREVLRSSGFPRGADADRAAFPAHVAPVSPRAYLRQALLAYRLRTGVEGNPLGIEEAAVGLVSETVRAAMSVGPETLTVTSAHREIAEAARRAIAARVPRGASLAEIAREIGVSACHLCRVFRRVTGGSLHAHALRLRIRRSLHHVVERPGGDLSGIAHDFGFSSHSHFTAAFRREFGMTPSEARASGRPPKPAAPVR